LLTISKDGEYNNK